MSKESNSFALHRSSRRKSRKYLATTRPTCFEFSGPLRGLVACISHVWAVDVSLRSSWSVDCNWEDGNETSPPQISAFGSGRCRAAGSLAARGSTNRTTTAERRYPSHYTWDRVWPHPKASSGPIVECVDCQRRALCY